MQQPLARVDLDAGARLTSRLDFAPMVSLNKDVDFEANKVMLMKNMGLLSYKQDFRQLADICGPAPDGLAEYVRSLQPVHRVRLPVFQAILRDGGLRSRALQDQLSADCPVNAAVARLERHTTLGAIMRRFRIPRCHTRAFVEAAKPLLELKLVRLPSYQQRDATGTVERHLATLRSLLESIVDVGNVDEVISKFESLVNLVASHTKGADSSGVHHPADKKLGTYHHVFSIIGANMGATYGDVVLILKPEIMQHPDFNMSITAATSYITKRTFFHRPWVALGEVINYEPAMGGLTYMDDDGDVMATVSAQQADAVNIDVALDVVRDGVQVQLEEAEAIELFHKAKFHPSTPDWEKVIAQDLSLQCRLLLMSKRKIDPWVDNATGKLREELLNQLGKGSRTPTVADITCDIIKEWYATINSHGCIEGHLPEFVPLDYIEKVVVPYDVYADMKDEWRGFELSDGRHLDSIIEPLHARHADFQHAARAWQRDFFLRRSAPHKHGIGSALDVRAFSFGLEGLQGREVFLPLRLCTPREGFIVRFRAKGQHLRVSFLNAMEDSRNRPVDNTFHVYFIAIGVNQNQVTFMKRHNNSGGQVCAKVLRNENMSAMAWPDRYRDYWVTFNASSGDLVLGHGGPDTVGKDACVLLKWRDQAPHNDIQYIAVSCWDTPVSFAMFKHMDALI